MGTRMIADLTYFSLGLQLRWFFGAQMAHTRLPSVEPSTDS